MNRVTCYPSGEKAPNEADVMMKIAKNFILTQKNKPSKVVTPIKVPSRDLR